MTMLSTAETEMRSAADALRAWFPAPGAASAAGTGEALFEEQAAVTAALAVAVTRMGAETDSEALDAVTDEAAALLARAEEIRLALVLAARAADETWLLSLDLD
ncbi:hypothetical protein [Amnibacterium setariae]|uniref:hypothetical protein n=1 Tax=Amnibacterium setariae TaxID=2306585 RepID=UPI0013148801|nr:hypothetical protein [Amnibacterium setariae]